MLYAELMARAQALGGTTEPSRIDHVIEAVSETLGERLPEEDAEALAAELPAPAASWLRRRRLPGRFSRSELFDRVQRRSGERRALAIELAQAVCEAIAEAAAGTAALSAARAALSPELADLLSQRDRRSRRVAPPPRFGADHPYAHSLATGRPGSAHPVSEARPEPAHSQSVARSDDPHGETKLSGARGLTQERLDESLATARPGSSRPIGG